MAVFSSLEELFEDMHRFFAGGEPDVIPADAPEHMLIGWAASGSRFGLWQIRMTDVKGAMGGPLSSALAAARTREGRLAVPCQALALCCPKCHKFLVPVHDEELCVTLSVMRS